MGFGFGIFFLEFLLVSLHTSTRGQRGVRLCVVSMHMRAFFPRMQMRIRELDLYVPRQKTAGSSFRFGSDRGENTCA